MDTSKKHDTPFGEKLASRNAVAVILSFMGRGPESAQLMQILSMRSRGFFISQEGLAGFLPYFNPKIWLHELQKKTDLIEDNGRKQGYGPIDSNRKANCVESIGKVGVDRCVKGLASKRTAKSQLEWLKKETFLYWIVLKYAGCTKEYQEYVEKSKNGSPFWYTFYANFHLKFWFEDLKRDEALKEGKKKITCNGKEWDYEGPVDENGVACGIGKATRSEDEEEAKQDRHYKGGMRQNLLDYSYYGSFVNDKFEGIGILAK